MYREGGIHMPHESGPEDSFESWFFSSTVWGLGTEFWHGVFGLHQLILPTEQSHWSRSINLKALTKRSKPLTTSKSGDEQYSQSQSPKLQK